MNDAAGNIAEGSTFCKLNDTFRPGLVNTPEDGVGHQLCPNDLTMGVDELTDANPTNWYVRVMFDELLDPSVEDLVEITDASGMDTGTAMGTLKNTQPFTLQCQSVNGGALVNIPYDGYYSPSGNKITWPVGPSLVVVPNSPALVATQSECQLTLKDNIKDKDGNPVPTDQRGPYKFKIAPVAAVASSVVPADGGTLSVLPPDDIFPAQNGVDVLFNTVIDSTSLVAPKDPTPDGTESFEFTPHVLNSFARDITADTGTPTSEILFGGDFEVATKYTWAMKQGAKVKDQCGRETTFGAPSVDAGTQVGFTTAALKFNGISPFDTQMNAKASSYIHLKFNQFMDPASLAASEFSITPTPTSLAVGVDTNSTGDLLVKGDFAPDTDYVFTLKNGATITDCPGNSAILSGTPCVPSAMGTFTNTADQVVHFHTAPTAITATSPADNGEVDKTASTDPLDIAIVFNTLMLPATLTTTEWSITPAVPMSLLVTTKSSAILLESDNPIPAGDYVFTLKMGATIDQAAGGTYTQAADKVIHIKVVDPAPSQPAPACF